MGFSVRFLTSSVSLLISSVSLLISSVSLLVSSVSLLFSLRVHPFVLNFAETRPIAVIFPRSAVSTNFGQCLQPTSHCGPVSLLFHIFGCFSFGCRDAPGSVLPFCGLLVVVMVICVDNGLPMDQCQTTTESRQSILRASYLRQTSHQNT